MIVIFLSVALFALAFYGWLHSDGNLCEVIPNRLYRSAQPSGQVLEKLHRENGIRTIVNLRGEHPGEPWYDDEKAFADRHGIELISMPLSAGRVLSEDEMRRLGKILTLSAQPLLVHCKSGSDRTGLACAMYLQLNGSARGLVEGQLSVRYGHFPYLWSESQAMDESLARFGGLRPNLALDSSGGKPGLPFAGE